MFGETFPLVGNVPGLQTHYGSWIAPGGRVAAYVGPPGTFEDTYNDSLRVPLFSQAVNRVRPGKNDTIVVLPGFSENIFEQLSSIPAGTRILGVGTPGESTAPKLTWTNANASLVLAQANITIKNMTLDFSGVADCLAPLVVTAPGCALENCRVILQNDQNSWSCVRGVTLSTGAHWFRLVNCDFEADSEDDDANVTGGALNVNSAVVGLRVESCSFDFACPGDTVGIVNITHPARKFIIRNNLFNQLASDGAYGLVVADVAAHGKVIHNGFFVSENVAPVSAGALFGGSTRILNWDNVVSASSSGGAAPIDPLDT